MCPFSDFVVESYQKTPLHRHREFPANSNQEGTAQVAFSSPRSPLRILNDEIVVGCQDSDRADQDRYFIIDDKQALLV